MRTILVVLVIATGSVAAQPTAPTQIVGQVVDAKRAAIEGATIQVGAQTTHSNASGHYRIVVPPGTYAVSIDYGTVHQTSTVTVVEHASSIVDAKLAIDLGEVIPVHARLVKPVPPRQLTDPGIVPRYSDAAVMSDTWSRAWLLLDIDATGRVSRVKWLKRPGHDLDAIAVETAMATKFAPARDEHGLPGRTYVVHLIEWPSYWWLSQVEGVTTHRSYMRNAAPDNPFVTTGQAPRDPSLSVPCAGSGPLNLDRRHPVYRDCTPPPDPSKFASEPWITRP